MRDRTNLKRTKVNDYDVVMQEVKDAEGNKKFTAMIQSKDADNEFLSERVFNNFVRTTDKYSGLLEGDVYPFLINVDTIEAAESTIKEMLDVFDNRDKKAELRANVEELLEGFDSTLEDLYEIYYVDLSGEQKKELYEQIKKVMIDYIDKI